MKSYSKKVLTNYRIAEELIIDELFKEITLEIDEMHEEKS